MGKCHVKEKQKTTSKGSELNAKSIILRGDREPVTGFQFSS